MPRWHCAECVQHFSSTHNFLQHINGRRNTKCKLRYERELTTKQPGAYGLGNIQEKHTTPPPNIPPPPPPNVTRLPTEQDKVPVRGQPKDDSSVSDEAMGEGGLDKFANDEHYVESNADESDGEPMDEGGDAMDEGYPTEDEAADKTFPEKFRKYVAHGKKNFRDLQPEYVAAIQLMDLLNKEGASLTLYEKLFEWHITNLTARKKVSEGDLMQRLRKRYNMLDTQPYERKVLLPHSEVQLKVPCHDCGAMLTDLLTDPQIKEEDYLFFNDDPMQGPPDEWMELKDINTGLAYRKTYDELILPEPYTVDGRMKYLCPVVPYMDGTRTGSMFQNMGLELMKITLGIFNIAARDKAYCWRNLGAVPSYEKAKHKAAEFIERSTHLDAPSYLTDSESDDNQPDSVPVFPDFDVYDYIDSSGDEDGVFQVHVPDTNAQDLHQILHVILGSYRRIQDNGGFAWDLHYKGKIYRLQFIPFVIFVKGDTVEHDKHCGKYGTRTGGVAQLCRYCTCPTMDTNLAYVDHERKTQPMMTELVRKKGNMSCNNCRRSLFGTLGMKFGLVCTTTLVSTEPVQWKFYTGFCLECTSIAGKCSLISAVQPLNLPLL